MRIAAWVFVLFACSGALMAEPLAPHEVTDTWGAGSKSIWYFIVVPKKTSTVALQKIAEHYAAEHPEALVLNVDIFCDRKYASYARGIQTPISDREFYSHVLYSYAAGSKSDAHGAVNHTGQGSACGK